MASARVERWSRIAGWLALLALAAGLSLRAHASSNCATPDTSNPITTCYFDLTAAPSSTQTPTSAVLNGGIFRVPAPTSELGTSIVGTGVFQPFLRVQATGVEQGFNTDSSARYLDNHDQGGTNWNHSIKLNEVPIVTVCDGGGATGTNCQQYYQFLLDINERDNTGDYGLSLDSFKLYVGATGSLNANSVTGGCAPDTTNGGSFALCGASEVYDMDQVPGGDAALLMDYRNYSGSGKGVDLEALVPTANFQGALGDSYVYLYSKFGATGTNCNAPNGSDYPCKTPGGTLASASGSLNYASDAGFEEWSIRKVARVSIPSTLLLLGAGMLAGMLRRPRRPSAAAS